MLGWRWGCGNARAGGGGGGGGGGEDAVEEVSVVNGGWGIKWGVGDGDVQVEIWIYEYGTVEMCKRSE